MDAYDIKKGDWGSHLHYSNAAHIIGATGMKREVLPRLIEDKHSSNTLVLVVKNPP